MRRSPAPHGNPAKTGVQTSAKASPGRQGSCELFETFAGGLG